MNPMHECRGNKIKIVDARILDLFPELIRGLGTRLDSLNFESSPDPEATPTIQNLKSKI
jgi:hypothetical protein